MAKQKLVFNSSGGRRPPRHCSNNNSSYSTMIRILPVTLFTLLLLLSLIINDGAAFLPSPSLLSSSSSSSKNSLFIIREEASLLSPRFLSSPLSTRLYAAAVNDDDDDDDDDKGKSVVVEGPTITVPITELEKDLTAQEKSVTSVVRNCRRSVAYVTSVLPEPTDDKSRRRRRSTPPPNNNNNNNKDNGLPDGRNLGSGSGFVVERDGYVVTNYHVIQTAYQVQRYIDSVKINRNNFISNITKLVLPPALKQQERLQSFVNTTVQTLVPNLPSTILNEKPTVYVKINEESKYQSCRIVNVKPELDVAVLKIIGTGTTGSDNNDTDTSSSSCTYEPIKFGSSDELIVGQQLVAIGNPFGLDNTVTSGVVSALGRDYPGAVAGNTIKNCIQTDCAINPGNSGGPLLNLKSQVIGVNTAIITTSGSNAGIGFAIPSNDVKAVTDKIIRNDRIDESKKNGGRTKKMGYLGISIIDTSKLSSSSSFKTLFQNNMDGNDDDKTSGSISSSNNNNNNKLWISNVEKDSPAYKANIKPLQMPNKSNNNKLVLGDCIVGIGGRTLQGGSNKGAADDFLNDMSTRISGEEISLTLEDGVTKERRVVYIKLE